MRIALAVAASALLSLFACGAGLALGISPLTHDWDLVCGESLVAQLLALAAGAALAAAVRPLFRVAAVLACLVSPLIGYAAGRSGYQTSSIAEDPSVFESLAHQRGLHALACACVLVMAAAASGASGLLRAGRERQRRPG